MRVGLEEAGTPWVNTPRLANALPNIDSQDIFSGERCSHALPEFLEPVQPVAGLLPAISAALIAPIEVPITQSGSMPASLSP